MYLIMKINFLSLIILFLPLNIWTADQHHQTTVNPKTGELTLNIPYQDPKTINLYHPNVQYSKFSDGQLKFISFHEIGTYFEISFYPQKIQDKEKIAIVKRFKTGPKIKLLDGPSMQLDEDGNIISLTEWSMGKLNGKQEFYSEKSQLTEKREFENNLPIKKWVTFYPNGQVSSEIIFPASETEWKKTEIPNTKLPFKNNLRTANYPHPFTATLTWYYPNGKKSKEIEYLFYKNNEQILLLETGKATFYGPNGKKIGSKNTPNGNGKEQFSIHSLGIHYQKEITWFNNSIFKVIHSQNPD